VSGEVCRLAITLQLMLCGDLAAAPSVDAGAAARLDAHTVHARVERWLRPYAVARDFSGVVLIAQADRVLVAQAFGEADFAQGRPNRTATRFHIASLSKTFTPAVIEHLAAAGRLSLQDTLGRYVDGIPNGDAITIRQSR
jgi:CubicO group peptidase (beta-lactamase class C family)